MKIKKFQARTFSEALVMVKREMGNDAVILASEEQPGLRKCVEVTAAVDYEPQGRQGRSNQLAGGPARAPRAASPDRPARGGFQAQSPARAEQAAEGGDMKQLKSDIEDLKRTLGQMRDRGYEMSLPESRRKMLAYLKKRKIDEELAFGLCENAEGLDEMLSAMADQFDICGSVGARKAIVMIGPTGVGKTTTIAKLAARAMKNGRKTAIINLDTYRIGAIEQMRIYARIMGIPLDVVSEISGLKASLSKFSDRDVVFIDTTGRNPRDTAYIEELLGIYRLGVPVETHLLMSAHSDGDFMADSHRYYRKLPIDCLGFTKVDEAVRYGSIYNLSRLYRKPVGYITTGQRVPQDLSFPTSEKLAGMILKGGEQYGI